MRKTFLNRRFLTFCLLGCVNTFNASLFSFIAEFLLHKNLAAIFGYLASLVVAFFLSCRFVFKKPPKLSSIIRFFISYIPNFILFNLVSIIAINAWGWRVEWATAVAIMIGGPLTFVIIKLYAFGSPHKFANIRKTDTPTKKGKYSEIE